MRNNARHAFFRRLIGVAFSNNALHEFRDALRSFSMALIEVIANVANDNDGIVDMNDWFNRFSFDVHFGFFWFKYRSQEQSLLGKISTQWKATNNIPGSKLSSEASDLSAHIITFPGLPSFYAMFPLSKQSRILDCKLFRLMNWTKRETNPTIVRARCSG